MFKTLEGKTITRIIGCFKYSEEIIIYTTDGSMYRMRFSNTRSDIKVEDVIGELSDVIDSPILRAEERSSNILEKNSGIEQWTFYTISSIKGSIDIRWHGASNGYYSTNVKFELIE